MHFNPSLFLVYALSGSLLGILTSAEPLIGTAVSEAVNGKYPYVVSVAKRINNIPAEKTHICTGSLIANNFVLTAAHCFNNFTAEEIRLIVGKVDLRDGIWYNASKLITYDQWADSKNITKKYSFNDIAIIKLEKKVHGQTAKPVTLSYKATNNLNDETVVLAGWGWSNEVSVIPSRYLREASVRILAREFCQDELYDIEKKRVRVSEKYICTKADRAVAVTHGDSGGPVLKDNALLGISVNGILDSLLNVPDANQALGGQRLNLHISIHVYRDFITDAMKH